MAGTSAAARASQIQARLFTKDENLAIPDAPFSIPANSSIEDLTSLVNQLLQDSKGGEWEPIDFDFLVAGELLRLPLLEHLQTKDISTEVVVEIEYIQRLPAPEPHDSLNHDDWVSAASCNGDWIITGCYDNTIHLWKADGKHRLTIPGHSGPVKGVTWLEVGDPFATFASVSHDQTLMLWKLDMTAESVECIQIGRGHERSVECVAADPTKTFLATGSWDSMVKVWAATVEQGRDDESQTRESTRKRAKGDGKSLSRTPLMTLGGHKEAIGGVVWTESQEVMSASWDHTLKIWDSEVGGIKTDIAGNKAFFAVDWSATNRTIITASADRHLRLYDPRSQEGSVVKSTFTSHSGWASSVKWSTSDSHLFISGGHDNLLKLWDTRSPQAPLYDMTGHEDKILCCDWSNPAFMTSGSADNTLKIFASKQ